MTLDARFGKYCPSCGSARISSGNQEPLHCCLDCGHHFTDAEAVRTQQ